MAHLTAKEILARSDEFLRCADYAVQNDCFHACAICSYAALFWAARVALAYEGFDRPIWQHGELRSKFTEELIKNRTRYPRNFGKWLCDAFALRNVAQYQLGHPKTKEVRRMVYHAKEFIKKIDEILNK
ncbi:MAG: HEPN domain-containing protein [candidate division KSB1 bacterium]|nr:HEPN domain-containing protein [candidate division KSB1 bacterium]MDZ7365012.1 HEPN domain-containing protein [candidate division KSB1 bacterium]MDZ7403407.1 HEPN domain-containing protein [candidate division KSB1 bacterium]